MSERNPLSLRTRRPAPQASLLICLGGVGCSFAADTPEQYLFLLVLIFLAIALLRIPAKLLAAPLWRFRWLLLGTLVAHLLLSSGETLGGTSWLFRDGAFTGARMAGRLAMALSFASLLCVLTRPEELAAIVTSMLAPLRRLGIDTGTCRPFLALVFSFLPLVGLNRPKGHRPGGVCGARGLSGRLRALGQLMEETLERLLLQARQRSAHSRGGRDLELTLPTLGREDLVFLAIFLVAFSLFWRLG